MRAAGERNFAVAYAEEVMDPVWSAIAGILGLDQEVLNVGQMAFRAALVYIMGLVLVRLGEKRFIGKFSAFDVIMGIMLGSILSRAITTADGFFATLAAASMLILMHYAFAVIAYHSERVGNLVKGQPRTLVRDGQVKWDGMREAHITENDLLSALRETAKTDDVSKVKRAYLERSGNISAILADD